MTPSPTAPSATDPIAQAAEHLFRHESGRLVATLTRIFGVQHLNLAEDVVQEALAKALQTWPYYGLPKNPSAWLTQVAKNLALDVVRRDKLFRDKENAVITHLETSAGGESAAPDAVVFDEEIRDNRLRLLFVCCHPEIPHDSQVALALKTLCGFSTEEIATAFLTTDQTIAKRLTRAKQRLRDAGVAFEIPEGDELAARLDAVLQTLYLLFNEGYKASFGEKLIREELCQEAIRLTSLLAEHVAGNRPVTHALLALMFLNAARLESRVDSEGLILRLEEQDRSRWDQTMISQGMRHLALSATGEELTEYHLQAGIAACHCAAPDYASTDWPQILTLYDRLIALDPSPVIALNRAVALANVRGPAAGLKAVEAISPGSPIGRRDSLREGPPPGCDAFGSGLPGAPNRRVPQRRLKGLVGPRRSTLFSHLQSPCRLCSSKMLVFQRR
jgi:RNA polymerase sigma factor (sigma-70 family)